MHTYTLNQWKMVWTMFIEKDFNSDLNQLWCIMILKADWQLFLKWHLAYGFLPKSKSNHMLMPLQGGSHKDKAHWSSNPADSQNRTCQIKPATSPRLFSWPLSLIWLYNWNMPHLGLLTTWCHGWLPLLACTNALHDEVLCPTLLQHLFGIQHVQKSFLAQCRARHCQCCPLVYCSLWFAHWCITLPVPTACSTTHAESKHLSTMLPCLQVTSTPLSCSLLCKCKINCNGGTNLFSLQAMCWMHRNAVVLSIAGNQTTQYPLNGSPWPSSHQNTNRLWTQTTNDPSTCSSRWDTVLVILCHNGSMKPMEDLVWYQVVTYMRAFHISIGSVASMYINVYTRKFWCRM